MSRISKKFIRFGTGTNDVNSRDLPANYTPAAYTPSEVASEGTDKVSAHLKGINNALAAVGAPSVVSISSNVTLTANSINLVDTSAARSLTLPTPTSGTQIVIKDKTGSVNVNNITVVRAGSEKIETVAANYTVDEILKSITLVSDGTDWFIV
jgi:hypothetical protein